MTPMEPEHERPMWGAIMMIIGLLATVCGAVWLAQDSRIGKIEEHQRQDSLDIAILKTNSETIKTDVGEIKQILRKEKGVLP